MSPVRQRLAGSYDTDRGQRALAREPVIGARAHERQPASALLELQAAAGNAAVATLVAGAGAGPADAVQRSTGAPPVVQRSGGGGLLRVGSRGRAVTALQEALNRQGAELAADGIFGRGTKAAVMDHQASAGLAVDGLVGPATRASLGLRWGGAGGAGGGGMELGHRISQEVEHRIGGAGGGGGSAGRGGGTFGARGFIPAFGGTSVGGSYDTGSGTVRGEAESALGGVSGSYRPETGDISAGVHGRTGAGAGGTYNTETGAASGGVRTNSGQEYQGSYNPATGVAEGSYQSGSGSTTAGGSVDIDSGTGSGHVNTPYGSGNVQVGDDSVHAEVDVPGFGSVGVDVPIPDWGWD